MANLKWRKIKMERKWITGSLGLTIPVLSLAIWLWIMNVLGIEHWVAIQIGDFIRQVIEASN